MDYSVLLVDSGTFVLYGKSDGILDKGMIHIHCISHQDINACIVGKIMDCVKWFWRKYQNRSMERTVVIFLVRVNGENWTYEDFERLSDLGRE